MKTHLNFLRPTSTLRCFALSLGVLTIAGIGHAQTAVRDQDRVVRTGEGERVKLKNPDKEFVEKVAKKGMEEAEISRVAAQRTSNPRVRALAEAMADEHAAMSKELNVIASDKGVVLPAKDDIGEKWLKRDAKSFDLDYLKRMVSDHEETVRLFQKQARDGHDPELVAFARKHLAALQHHLQEASDLHKSMK